MDDIKDCDFCNTLPASYTVSMDERAQADAQIDIGDIYSCRDCLSKSVDIGLRVFGECTVRKVLGKA